MCGRDGPDRSSGTVLPWGPVHEAEPLPGRPTVTRDTEILNSFYVISACSPSVKRASAKRFHSIKLMCSCVSTGGCPHFCGRCLLFLGGNNRLGANFQNSAYFTHGATSSKKSQACVHPLFHLPKEMSVVC